MNVRKFKALLLLFVLVATAFALTKYRNLAISNSTMDSTPIGSSSPSTGSFTNITLNGTLISKVQFLSNSSACTTGSSGHDSCLNTMNWPVSFSDVNYSFSCSCSDASIGTSGETAVFNVFSRTASTITTVTQTEHDGRSAHCQVISCIGIHP